MRRLRWYVPMLAVAALVLVLGCRAQAQVQQPFTVEIDCTIALNNYICTQTVTPSGLKSFVIETVSFSGQASLGQTVGASFSFPTGGKTAFVWLPVQSLGASPTAGNGVYAATLPVRLNVDLKGAIRLEVYRNSSTNAGQSAPYVQRLNLMGYLQ